MKLIIALAFLTVVSAFPPSPRFTGYRNDDYQLREPRSNTNISPQINNELIKAYIQLIDNLSRLSHEGEEEDVVNGIIESIISMGQIINSNGFGDDSPRPPKPQRPEDEQGDAPKPPSKEPDTDVNTPSVEQNNEEIPSISEEPASSTSNADEIQGTSSFLNEPVNESEEGTQSYEELPQIA